MQLNSDDRVTAVSLANPESLAHPKVYPDLLLSDCTYETTLLEMKYDDVDV